MPAAALVTGAVAVAASRPASAADSVTLPAPLELALLPSLRSIFASAISRLSAARRVGAGVAASHGLERRLDRPADGRFVSVGRASGLECTFRWGRAAALAGARDTGLAAACRAPAPCCLLVTCLLDSCLAAGLAAGRAALVAGAFTVDLRATALPAAFVVAWEALSVRDAGLTAALLTGFAAAFAAALVVALTAVLPAVSPAAGFFDPAAFALVFTFAVLTLRTTEPSQQMNRKSMAD